MYVSDYKFIISYIQAYAFFLVISTVLSGVKFIWITNSSATFKHRPFRDNYSARYLEQGMGKWKKSFNCWNTSIKRPFITSYNYCCCFKSTLFDLLYFVITKKNFNILLFPCTGSEPPKAFQLFTRSSSNC